MKSMKRSKNGTPAKKEAPGKQKFIPGTEPVSIPEIEEVAKHLAESQYNRLAWAAEEKKHRDALRQVMAKFKVTEYRFESYVATVSATESRVNIKEVATSEQ